MGQFYSYQVQKTLARFNWARNEQQWQLCVRLPDNSFLSELWDEDDEPDVDLDTPPSEVVELISARLESYLMHSERDKKRQKIAYARTVYPELDRQWATRRIGEARDLIARMESLIADTGIQEEVA
jgi:hypothetical protein